MHVLVDLDGTLADSIHRAPYAPDWDKFYGAVPHDLPIPEMVTLVKSLMHTGNQVSFITGRPERAREVTLVWLRKHVMYGKRLDTESLYMQADGNLIPNHEFKLSMCRWLLPDLIIDDDENAAQVLYDDSFKVLLFLRDKKFVELGKVVDEQAMEKPPTEPFPSHHHPPRTPERDIVQDATRDRADLDARRLDP